MEKFTTLTAVATGSGASAFSTSSLALSSALARKCCVGPAPKARCAQSGAVLPKRVRIVVAARGQRHRRGPGFARLAAARGAFARGGSGRRRGRNGLGHRLCRAALEVKVAVALVIHGDKYVGARPLCAALGGGRHRGCGGCSAATSCC